MRITKSNFPESSLIKNIPSDYADSYSVAINAKDLTVERVCKSFFTSAPAWVEALLMLCALYTASGKIDVWSTA